MAKESRKVPTIANAWIFDFDLLLLSNHPSSMQIRFLLSLLALLTATPANAQLDSIHWLPPMHARYEWGPQYLYLTTPEVQPFEVTIRDGAGTLVVTATLSNATPFRLDLGTTDDTKILVPESALHQALTGRGLIIEGSHAFFATFRAHSTSQNQAGDLTCKGRAALGKTFRIGHLEQAVMEQPRRCNFIGILATEDSTEIRLSGYDAKTAFRINGQDVKQSPDTRLTLQKGESAVFSNYINGSATFQPPNGLMGALLESSRPIAVNTGSWLGVPVTMQAHDIGIDQIVPVELVGDEYILCKGNGSSVLECPVIIAHTDHTEVRINGNSKPVTTLNAGEYYLARNDFSVVGNMYIQTSEPVYVYQIIGGANQNDDQFRTAGLMFVPPLSCGIPNAVDNIYQPNSIGSMRFEGGLMIVAMRDSLVTVFVNGLAVPLGLPDDVPGNLEFVTYRKLNLFNQSTVVNTVSVRAQGAVQVAMFGRNQPASFAAFFSGFTKTNRPNVQLTKIGDGVCPDTLVASGHFDGVEWRLDGQVLQSGPDTSFVAYTPGDYIVRGYLGVCRRTDFAADTIQADFTSPAFSYEYQTPSCYGFSDGSFTFGTPSGGIAPYSFSMDNGASFQTAGYFSGLSAGNYQLIARDSTGCYNRPLKLAITQPDSFSVQLIPTYLPDPLNPGEKVVLTAQPDREIVLSTWTPDRNPACPDCLDFTFFPEFSTWVEVTVLDSAGCPATDRIQIAVTPNVYAPNVFMPASNDNDVFALFSRDALPVVSMAVFDRWGELVFRNTHFLTNDLSAGWDGMFRGQLASAGVYAFEAEVEVLPGKTTLIKGDVTLMR